jgi:hypothetical protein
MLQRHTVYLFYAHLQHKSNRTRQIEHKQNIASIARSIFLAQVSAGAAAQTASLLHALVRYRSPRVACPTSVLHARNSLLAALFLIFNRTCSVGLVQLSKRGGGGAHPAAPPRIVFKNHFYKNSIIPQEGYFSFFIFQF